MADRQAGGAAGQPRGPWDDAAFVAHYDQTFARWVAPLAAEPLLALAAPRAEERVLECACGTGALTAPLAARLGPATPLLCADRAPAMLAVAAAKTYPPAGARPAFALADLLALGLQSGQFDLAVCNLALQIVPDRPAALAELRRVLRPGGRLAFCVPGAWSLEPFWTLFWSRVARPDAAGALTERPRRWTAPDIAAALLRDREEWRRQGEAAGFERLQLSVESAVAWFPSVEAFFATGPFGHIGRARELVRDEAARERVFADIGAGLARGKTSRGVPLDITVLCVLGQAPPG